jgi:uncharacterized OsmC-like protein
MRAARLGVPLETLEVTAESESDNRGILGMDAGISAGLSAVRLRVRIRGDAEPEALKQIVAWANDHSPVGCTLQRPAPCTLDVEVL